MHAPFICNIALFLIQSARTSSRTHGLTLIYIMLFIHYSDIYLMGSVYVTVCAVHDEGTDDSFDVPPVIMDGLCLRQRAITNTDCSHLFNRLRLRPLYLLPHGTMQDPLF